MKKTRKPRRKRPVTATIPPSRVAEFPEVKGKTIAEAQASSRNRRHHPRPADGDRRNVFCHGLFRWLILSFWPLALGSWRATIKRYR
jgi:hypothetical protein